MEDTTGSEKMPVEFFSDDEIISMQSWIIDKIQENEKKGLITTKGIFYYLKLYYGLVKG
ncbi:hypothetical protein [Thermoplasma sp. Kam2015]|uniref:hypothetical protein n=1 Tax=Thermoplasma sp. Kam2015 TaxID=2094122 RepID=UPI001292E7A8|nr:hypothetical protein [Thermoplasma sp. Kam2015]